MSKFAIVSAKVIVVLLAFHNVSAFADAGADRPAFKRRIISMSNSGKATADIVLPIGISTDVKWTAQKTEFLADGTVHVVGKVQLSLVLDKLTPISLLGDEMTLRSEELSVEAIEAIEDLKKMGVSGALFRQKPGSLTEKEEIEQVKIDIANMKRLEAIIERFGWPGNRFGGISLAKNAFLVLQHSDKASQHKYLSVYREAVAKGDADGADLALLEDRVLVSDGKPQLYGTQFKSTSPLVLYPIFDEPNLESRRNEQGLPPMKEYKKFISETYKVK
jgi:hypothetical protein